MALSIEELEKEYKRLNQSIENDLRQKKFAEDHSVKKGKALIVSFCVMVEYNDQDLKRKIREMAEQFVKNPSQKLFEKIINELRNGLENDKIEKSIFDYTKSKGFEDQVKYLSDSNSLGFDIFDIHKLTNIYEKQGEYISYIEKLCSDYVDGMDYIKSLDRDIKKKTDELKRIEHKLNRLRQYVKLDDKEDKDVYEEDYEEKDDQEIEEYIKSTYLSSHKEDYDYQEPKIDDNDFYIEPKEVERKVTIKEEKTEKEYKLWNDIKDLPEKENAGYSAAQLMIDNPEIFINNERYLNEAVVKSCKLTLFSRQMREICDHITEVLKYKSHGEIDTIDELNDLAKTMLEADFGKNSGIYDGNPEAKNLISKLCGKEGILEEYEAVYEKFMETHQDLPYEERKLAITPYKLVRMYNQKVEELIIASLPKIKGETWIDIFNSTSRMSAEDLASVYYHYQNDYRYNFLSEKDKSEVQKLFAGLIQRHHMSKTEDEEEIKRRYVAICDEYFSEEPIEKDYYKITEELPSDYAKSRIKSTDAVKEQRIRYFKQSKLKQALNLMNLGKLNQMAKKEVLTEEEIEKVRNLW